VRYLDLLIQAKQIDCSKSLIGRSLSVFILFILAICFSVNPNSLLAKEADNLVIAVKQDSETPVDPKKRKSLVKDDDEDEDSLLDDDEDDDEDSLLADDEDDDEDSLLADDEDDEDSLLADDDEETAEDKNDEEEEVVDQAALEHEALFKENKYPSAATCKSCHPKQYKEWSVSQHAYAQLSPIYMSMQRTINAATSSTNGDFCIRCHNQVGMNKEEDIFASNLDRHPTSREGITCVVCHRVSRAYGKVSGRIALEEGDLLQPVFGPTGNKELARVLDNRDQYRVVTDPDKSGRKIHVEAKEFFELTTPAFCGTCHDVNLFNGFRLEEAFSEYKHSPAAKAGTSCQDCHMGKIQGKNSGYEIGPAAIVGGVPTTDRKVTNHFFAGPDYSIIHPGIFPHNDEAQKMATLRDWLKFDVDAGWGTDKFEDDVSDDAVFPDRWTSIDDRYDARSIIEDQQKLLAWAEDKRLEVLTNGYQIRDVDVVRAGIKGIDFRVQVANGTDGHNVPTGFIAERLVALQVTVTDANDNVVFVSGDRDPNGDIRDSHSLYVHNGELPLDEQLFSLQSLFLVRMIRGGEREQVLPINWSQDPLPFVRPSTSSTILTGQPAGARTHRVGIIPNGHRWANYTIPADKLTGNGPYNANVKLISQMVPVNLIAAIQGVGWDYGMNTRQVADEVVKNATVVQEENITISVTK
jgi:Cytochrome c554 and c-prime